MYNPNTHGDTRCGSVRHIVVVLVIEGTSPIGFDVTLKWNTITGDSRDITSR